ncbi:MAG: SDR family oxidoreductase [Acidobacteriota bacterium]|jgi:putative NADH-flavin reductase
MNLLVFGATGGTGREIVRQALAQGHIITAFAPHPAELDIVDPRLHRVKGDVRDFEAVDNVVPGHHAVLSSLGSRVLNRNTVLPAGTRNIVQAMEKHGIRRLISVSCLGAGDSREHIGLLYNLLLTPVLMHAFIEQKEEQESIIMRSTLDWTVVRPGALTDGPRTGKYHAGFDPAGETDIEAKISRADLADFLLKQIEDETFLHQAPGLSY